ncbi:ribonuclease PH [Rickettsiales endosymbiont of Peranema trichophorum]|uniref:ribonuclease PH n=1 Tax=Rickettsiales endosymbiont of Peranema trichophorum TaxID=2486577 RepID=UPI0010239719|nr:ribonuclease PH [Rickettsiales endosymbiont of Peranema trichophorum]RZI47475.1 ribonuclease PH [Rickettsiales endosymbiont of Peranema trichophorum]
MRRDGRAVDKLRPVSYDLTVMKNSEDSCCIKIGNTHVICTATIEDKVPSFMKGQRKGWVTAEYSMLPRCSTTRVPREHSKNTISGRTQEIQRLIGRTLRCAVNLTLLGERQIIIDCDVINADGGTRTASITGGYIALYMACRRLVKLGIVPTLPVVRQVAAVSCGICEGTALLDLTYDEDKDADVDANFVIGDQNALIEIQACAEGKAFSTSQLMQMLDLAQIGTKELFKLQTEALSLA